MTVEARRQRRGDEAIRYAECIKACDVGLLEALRAAKSERKRTLAALDQWNVTLYSSVVIRSFRHKGLRQFFETGSKAGIQPAHAARLARIVRRLNRAASPEDMAVPGWNLHPLKGELAGRWAVWVSGNWRVTFSFTDGHATEVDYVDYH